MVTRTARIKYTMRHNRVVYPARTAPVGRRQVNGGVELMRWRLVFIAMAAVLAGCGSGGDDSKKMPVGVVFDSGGIGDKSFNDSANAGLMRAEQELGVEGKTTSSKSDKDYETNLDALAEKGCKVIFAVGYAQKDALTNVAAKYPNTKFALIDDELDMPNVRSLVFAEEQGSFLAGYLAALVSKTGKIGFVGGKTTPLIKKFEVGYVAGAETANPKIDVSGIKYTESWDDTSLGEAAASVLFNGGCDVVYHAAGRCGRGVIKAAQDAGKFAIGVDSDQDYLAPGAVLTSMVKHVDDAVYRTIKDVKDNTFTPGVMRFDLKSKGVGLTKFQYTKDKIGDANIKKIDEISQEIADGKIGVPSTADELTSYLASLKTGTAKKA